MIINPFANTNRSQESLDQALALSPLGAEFAHIPNPVTQFLARELALVWHDFTQRLLTIPIVQKIENGTITLEDYKILLINLRQQVVEGARWISRTASSMERNDLFPIRSALIRHAADEHRDYQMLEKMYVGLGGEREDILSRPRNIGTDALTGYIFHQASHPNPLNVLGAMFIIEGLGATKAEQWGQALKVTLKLEDKDILFMSYHSEHDADEHYNMLRYALTLPMIDQTVAMNIVKTAKVVGRLYCLQLEELDNY